jgi:hypothetical protein
MRGYHGPARMTPRWQIRSTRSLPMWAVSCFALVSSGVAGAGSEPAPAVAEIVVTSAGTVSGASSPSASPPDAVQAAHRDAEAEAAAIEAALPVLSLRALGGTRSVDLVPFGPDGAPRAAALERFSELLAPPSPPASWHRPPKPPEDPVSIDPRLARLLLDTSSELGGRPITIVSGHRKPGRGTSRKSFHVRGMAADIAVEGLKPIEVRAAAIRAGAGGVGLYPGFVHVDVRDEPYRWGGGGRVAPARRSGVR